MSNDDKWKVKYSVFNPETGEEFPLGASSLERLALAAESDEVRSERIKRFKEDQEGCIVMPVDGLENVTVSYRNLEQGKVETSMSNNKRSFTRGQLRDILWGEAGTIILNQITDQGRWDTHFRFIFKPEGEEKLYETRYSNGSTENQESSGPWEYDSVVECVEVEAYERNVIDYRPVSDA